MNRHSLEKSLAFTLLLLSNSSFVTAQENDDNTLVKTVYARPIGQAVSLVEASRETPSAPVITVPKRIIDLSPDTAINLDLIKRDLKTGTSAFNSNGAARRASAAPLTLRGIQPIKLNEATLRMIPKTITTPRATAAPVSTAPVSTAPASALPNALKLKDLDLIKSLPIYYNPPGTFVTPNEAASPESTLPSNTVAISGPAIFDLVATEQETQLNLASELGMQARILPDMNRNSGIYYYVPANYRLVYDKDYGGTDGLAFRISYDTLNEGADNSDAVRIAMNLRAAFDANGIAVTQELLASYARRTSNYSFRELRPLPMGSLPKFKFGQSLAGAVDPDSVSVVSYSDFLENLTVTWSTDAIRAENVRRLLSDAQLGIAGEAKFPLPSADQDHSMSVPAEVNLADPDVYDAVTFSRTGEIDNNSPLPVKLKYVHALVLTAQGGPRVYSWSLDNATVTAGEKFKLDLVDFPGKIDDMADRIWIDYRLDPSCENCIDQVINSVLRGGVWPDSGRIEFQPLPSLFSQGVAEIVVRTRSRFLSASDRSEQEAPVLYLSAATPSGTIYPVFLTDRTSPESGEAWSLLEYRLSAVLDSGETLEGENWIASDSLRLTPGSFQLEASLGRKLDMGESE